jgi:hypothetical protein
VTSAWSVDEAPGVGTQVKVLFLMVAAAVLLGSEAWPHPAPSAPLAGFSFSPEISQKAGRDPSSDLRRLLDATNPDLVRLPIYWEDVEPTPDGLDFTSVDSLLKVVAQHNRTARYRTRVVLTIGARNFLYPELHEPDWAGPRTQPFLDAAQEGPAYRAYFDSSITRYRRSHLLYAWQIENEPLDYVGNISTGEDRITASQLAWEMGEVHRLDPLHEAVLTTYDALSGNLDMVQALAPQLLFGHGSGHPLDALQTGDALGLDLYVDGPSVAFRHVTTIDVREEWKREALAFWAARAGAEDKGLWLTEMQAQPWGESTTFTTRDLLASAVDYRQENLQVALMWGVDTWLDDPAWLAAASRAMNIMRG